MGFESPVYGILELMRGIRGEAVEEEERNSASCRRAAVCSRSTSCPKLYESLTRYGKLHKTVEGANFKVAFGATIVMEVENGEDRADIASHCKRDVQGVFPKTSKMELAKISKIRSSYPRVP